MSQRSRLSLIIFQSLVFSLLFALFGRLFYLQILASDQYQDAAISIQSRDIVTPAVRGAITDINGLPMVVDLPGLVVSIDRSTLDKQPDKGVLVLARTANLFNLQYSDIYQRTRLCGELPKNNRAGCWNGTRYQPIPLVGGASQDLALKIMENADLYPGIEVQSVPIRSYPSLEGENVAHVLGYVGSVTDEDLKNQEETFYRNEVVGKTGIESVYNKYLRGIPGVRTVLVNRKEVVTKQSKNIKAIAGNNLITNIDAKLQAGAERALEGAIKRARASGYKGDSGAAVVLEIKTGRVLAMASYPTYDPAIWQKGLTVKQAEDLFSEEKGVPALSRPLQGLFAPASTFKSISVLAAANAGYSLDATYNCPASVLVGSRVFNNFDSKAAGRLSLEKGIAISCDSLWYQIAYDEWIRDGGLKPKTNTKDYFFNAANAFGIGKITGIDLPTELAGGTATGSFAGFPVAVSGKTGTAQVFGKNPNGSAKDDTSWFASYGPTENPQYAVVMMVSQGGFGASTSGVGVRDIYATLFGVVGNKVDPTKAVFPNGVPTTIAKVDLKRAASEVDLTGIKVGGVKLK